MPRVRPFRGLRPTAESAQSIIAPPYDVITSNEARALATDKPNHFLHVSKPEIDLPRDVPVYDPLVYAKGAENFQRFIRSGLLLQDDRPCFYLYRLKTMGHVQTGLAVTVSVEDYENNRIRKHEQTRPDKEDDRVHHMEALNAQTGPVFLVYPDDQGVEELTAESVRAISIYDDLDLSGVKHSLWTVNDSETIAAVTEIYNRIPTFYIADGHHRSAAAARVAARREFKDEAANYFLAVLFPASQVRILSYNRVVKDLNGLSPQKFIGRLTQVFSVSTEESAVQPLETGEFGMYLAGHWYRLSVTRECLANDGPVTRLDISMLTDRVFQPLLGIDDVRRDPRVEFIGGIRGLDELVRRVDSGEMAVAFSLFPTPLSSLFAVADAGKIMPPKSTWFEPKLADGLISHMLG